LFLLYFISASHFRQISHAHIFKYSKSVINSTISFSEERGPGRWKQKLTSFLFVFYNFNLWDKLPCFVFTNFFIHCLENKYLSHEFKTICGGQYFGWFFWNRLVKTNILILLHCSLWQLRWHETARDKLLWDSDPVFNFSGH
jgi:hypothetical protein